MPMTNGDDGLTFQMFAYPTFQPTWFAKISYLGRVMIECHLQMPEFTGNICHALSREHYGTNCIVTVHEPIDQALREIVHGALVARMNQSVEALLQQSNIFCASALKCKDVVLALLRGETVSNGQLYALAGYRALIMIMWEIPPCTPWGTENAVGTYDDTKRLVWTKPTLEEQWNLQVGYPIMLECIAKKMKLDANVSTISPALNPIETLSDSEMRRIRELHPAEDPVKGVSALV